MSCEASAGVKPQKPSVETRCDVKWLGNILGVLLSLMGLVWILQGTNILKTGFMAGHMQYALFGLVALAIGVGLIAISNRRRNKLSGGGTTPRA